MSEVDAPHGELCLERALGCGPCQLTKGHAPATRHLCDHYAKGGVEMHDPQDRYCGCPDCDRSRLAADVERAAERANSAAEEHTTAVNRLSAHDRRFRHEPPSGPDAS